MDNRHLMQGHLYTLEANENSNDGGDEAFFYIGSGVASWANSNKRTAERKVRCFTNPIPWVYVWVIQALGYLCTTYGGYYKTKILRTYIRQRPRGWKMAWKKEITRLSSRSFFTRTSCFTKEVLQRLALYRPYRMTPDRPHGRQD